MNKIYAALICGLICISICLAGCTSGNSSDKDVMKVTTVTAEDGSLSQIRDGVEKLSFTVSEEQKVAVSVKVASDKGSVNLKIYKSDDDSVIPYSGKEISNSEFKVNVDVQGVYYILIEADEFIGNYTFDINEE